MNDTIDQGGWGVCGFVSVLNGLRRAGLLRRLAGGGELPLVAIQVRLYAEILLYLKYLRFQNSPIIEQIELITNICRPPGEKSKDLDQIIQVIELWLGQLEDANRGKAESFVRKDMTDLIHSTGLTIAMSPEAIIDYMKWAGIRSVQYSLSKPLNCTSDNLILFKGCVIGLGGAPMTAENFGGLAHWIYVDRDGTMDNWGKKTKLIPGEFGKTLFGDWATHITHIIQMR